jgi:hypothetical protein
MREGMICVPRYCAVSPSDSGCTGRSGASRHFIPRNRMHTGEVTCTLPAVGVNSPVV